MKKSVNHRCTVDSVSIQLSPSAGEVAYTCPYLPHEAYFVQLLGSQETRGNKCA